MGEPLSLPVLGPPSELAGLGLLPPALDEPPSDEPESPPAWDGLEPPPEDEPLSLGEDGELPPESGVELVVSPPSLRVLGPLPDPSEELEPLSGLDEVSPE